MWLITSVQYVWETYLLCTNNSDYVQSMLTCFLNVSTVFRVAGLLAWAHQVVCKYSEDILVAHDEVRHNAVGSPVLVADCKPLLHVKHTKEFHIKVSAFKIQHMKDLMRIVWFGIHSHFQCFDINLFHHV